MGKWKILGGLKWNGKTFVSNDITSIEVKEEKDQVFYLEEGDLITPGLVDFHCHIAAPAANAEVNISDQLLASVGVVACVDGGTMGYLDWEDTDRFWKAVAITNTLSFLNLWPEGFTLIPNPNHSKANDISLSKLVQTFTKAQGRLLGFKVVLGSAKNKEEEKNLLALGRKAADEAGTIIMVHITNSLLQLEEIAAYLTPGDFLCHPFHGERGHALGEDGAYSKVMFEIKRSGVNIDVAVGKSHLSWDVAQSAIHQGFWPDVITSDQVASSWQKSTLRDLPHIISAFVAGLGMPLDEVFRAVTTTPAKHMGIQLDYGQNVSIFKKMEGSVKFPDSKGVLIGGEYEFRPKVIVRKNRVIVVKK